MKDVDQKYETYNLVEISRSRLLHNFDYLERLSGMKMLPVLKSNAYGHGIEGVSEILKARNFPYIAVNDFYEAIRIRAVSKQPVLIMGAVNPRNINNLKYQNFAFLVQDFEFVEALAKTGKRLKIHIDVDTGMKRYGFEKTDLPVLLEALAKYPQLELDGICTHLADGDNPDIEFTDQQVAQFDEAVAMVTKAGYKPKWVHISNTPGLLKAKSKYANSFRAGIGLYGINPLDPKDAGYKKMKQLKPVLKLISTITFVRSLKPGESVSYNRTWKADKTTKIGVLPMGYYEGIPRSLSNKGVVLAGDKHLTIVGRVCMNHLMINITGSKLKVGDQIVVISDDPSAPNSIEQMSRDFYFFSYGLLAKLSPDMRRVIMQ